MLIPARRAGRQLRLIPALLVPTARAVAWWPPLAAFTVSLGLLALAVRPGSVLEGEQLVQWLRIAIVAGALGWAFLLDDPSEPTTEGVAGSLLLRRALRVALLLPLTTAWWVAVVWRIRAVYPTVSLPVAAFTLEAAALLAVTMALAAAGSRLAPERRGGVVAAPALLALTSAAFLLPAQVTLYAEPGRGARGRRPPALGPAARPRPGGLRRRQPRPRPPPPPQLAPRPRSLAHPRPRHPGRSRRLRIA